MICLSDNDIIHKLAACDLLLDAWEPLGIAVSDVYVLPTVKHKFGVNKNSDKAANRYGSEIITRIRSFLSQSREIDFGIPEMELQVLGSVNEIDAGEAVLYAAACSKNCWVATGDKRSLRVLASSTTLRPIAERLKGRIVCLEQIIRRSIERYGIDVIKAKVVPALSCDTALRACFGSGAESEVTNVMHALDAYVTELSGLPVNLLIP